MAQWAYVTSNEHYRTAFGKLLRNPERGHMEFTAEESNAVQRRGEASSGR